MPNKPAVNSHKSSIGGLDANLMALIAYVGTIVIGLVPGIRYISWAAPLVIYFLEKESEFVRFHAMQSFVLHAIGAILGFVVNVLLGGVFNAAFYNPYTFRSAFGISALIGTLSWIISLAIFVFAVIAVINAYKYVEYRIPFVGKLADKVTVIISGMVGKK